MIPEDDQNEEMADEEGAAAERDPNMTMAKVSDVLGVPHMMELMTFFEDYHMQKFPKQPFLSMGKKCKKIHYH